MAAIRQTTKEKLITHERLFRINGKRGEKVNHKLDSLQLSRKDKVYVSRLRCGHSTFLHKIGGTLDTTCRKCRICDETVEKAIGECPRIHHPVSQLPEH